MTRRSDELPCNAQDNHWLSFSTRSRLVRAARRTALVGAGATVPNRRSGSGGPAFEFNWGAIPRVQLHAILPLGGIFPSNNPVYFPGGTGPSAFGLTDIE